MTVVHSRAIGPTSDLVVLAPWRDGIIGADEAILPATRFALTFRALFQIRRTAREAIEPTAFSDPIERLEQVHSFRVVAQPAGMLLSVTYDFGWEAYMRALWRDGGPFLDLLLCNCQGYRLARDTEIEAWSAWVRAREIAADYFYAATPLTVADMQALAQAEPLERDAADSDLKLAGFASRPAETAAAEIRARFPQAASAQALRILSAMHRLSRYYGADINADTALADDALTLLRATRGLLLGWDPATLNPAQAASHARELAWFAQERPVAAEATPAAAATAADHSNIQRGILTGFDRDGVAISHGAMLHLMVSDPATARRALGSLRLDSEAGAPGRPDPIFRNLGLTIAGLKRLGLPEAFLDTLPAPFHDGAAGRAGTVGDVRSHHPLRWQRLPRNWHADTGFVADAPPTVDLAIVDAVIQLRTTAAGRPTSLTDPDHPLLAEIRLLARLPGWVLLSVEGLASAYPNARGRDHFGFADGISQPSVGAAPGNKWSDKVPVSDLLLGYNGDAGTQALPLRDSSFLAIRRMPMKASAFEAMIAAGAAATGLDPELVAAKIVGRGRQGVPLVPHQGPNDFDFGIDPDGALVPRQSHVRRVNPRTGADQPPVPRIMRRGMSFGPPAAVAPPTAVRGNMFMAYCADLAEQYEVVLRWMNAANSSRIGSWLGDPLCGVPDPAPRTFRFSHDGKVYRVPLPAAADAPVGLSWSLYLLAPSLDLVRRIAATPFEPANRTMPGDRLGKARQLVASLVGRNAPEAEWRNWLDEPAAREAGMQAAIWQVIRDDHGGVLRAHDGCRPTVPAPGGRPTLPAAGPDTVLPAGPRQDLVLVATRATILQVLRDDGRLFSVRGAGRRIAPSIEKFHLGLDAFTADYQREGPACNAALARVSENESFDAARAATIKVLHGLLGDGGALVRVDIVRHLLEPALAAMAPDWFGLPDGVHIAPGASDWRDVGVRTPLFPGDFWNSSRYAFNPFESAETERASAIHGQAILKAARRWISATGRNRLDGRITRNLARARSGMPGEAGLAYPTDDDLARGVVGAMLGWVATTLGNGARLFDAWATTATLQRKQIAWMAMPVRDHAAARRVFDADMKATIGLAPVPECKWREAVIDTSLAGTPVRRDSKLILGLASAAAECPADSRIWFGQAPPGTVAPPHGCPGRSLALGVLLGVLAGVSETVLARPTGARLEMEISPLPGARPDLPPDFPPAAGAAEAR